MAKIWNGRPGYHRYVLILWHHRTGLIPTEIGQLINLTNLNLGDNELTGRWPKYEMVDQSTTGILLILWHHRTGLIPTEIGQLINLTFLHLKDNKLTGRCPKQTKVHHRLPFLSLTQAAYKWLPWIGPSDFKTFMRSKVPDCDVNADISVWELSDDVNW